MTTWIRFNAEDAVEIEVTASEDLGDPVTTELHSTTGSTVVGEAIVSPGSGPVGTDHEVAVFVDEVFEDVVGRVTVLVDGSRGSDEHALRQDSADHGFWVAELTSLGEPGEERSDTFEIQLWQLDSIDASGLLEGESE